MRFLTRREDGSAGAWWEAIADYPSSAPGIYCVSLADPGDLTGSVLFVVRIVHT